MIDKERIKIETKSLNVYYRNFRAVKNVSVLIPEKKITALIGPSGCGKSTFIRTLNRMVEVIPETQVEGEVLLDGENIYGNGIDVPSLRRRVGMVFQSFNPFPKSIFENVAYGLRISGERDYKILSSVVEETLKKAALWEEVHDKLDHSALALSGGQQQRLCIARALAVEPEVLLLDEPCSALDPIATAKIEELLNSLKKGYTIVIVTHNMQQAARISDYSGFFLLGELIEFNETPIIFTTPRDKRTEDYITGRFG
ncbi:MAG: phosphate ABC transporter ATP-binding protein PstB [Acidobacteriota bacterium]